MTRPLLAAKPCKHAHPDGTKGATKPQTRIPLLAGLYRQTEETRPPAVCASLSHFALLALLISLFSSSAHAGTWVPFGPQTYTRDAGAPVTVTNTFSVLNPSTQYTLHVVNGGLGDTSTELASGSVMTINGVQVVGPNNFNKNVVVLDVPVTLQLSNTISVQVKGKPGGVISVQIIGVDNDPPVISASLTPLPNPAGWNNSNVTVSFSCSDKTSGVSFCPQPISVITEGANQLISGTAKDKAGNTATASVTVNLDKTPPVISAFINPPPDVAGWNSSGVTVNFSCADALSGVAVCSSPVGVTSEGAGQVVTGTVTDVAGNAATTSVTVNISFKFFSVRNYAGKCLDYDAASVFLNDCASAHPVRVEEINDRHEVVLHTGNGVIGIHNPQVISQGGPPPPPQTEYALELQSYNPILGTTANQIFALDGDSIILAGSRPCFNTDTTVCPPPPPQLVVQIQNARGANRSPLVAGLRNLADSEFWDFNSVDGSARYPTTGFRPVATNVDLWNEVCKSPVAANNGPPRIFDPGQPDDGKPAPCDVFNPSWGRVIVVTGSDPLECGGRSDVGACIDLSDFTPLVLNAGITLRGDRRGSNFGPQLFASYKSNKIYYLCEWCMIDIHGDYVRVTGLRLRGQSRSTDDVVEPAQAIEVDSSSSNFASSTLYIALIDHNDISDWESATVNVNGGQLTFFNCALVQDDPATQDNVRIQRNFLHHNERWPEGYGSLMSFGGRADIFGNTFLMNRHAIAAGGEAHEEYRAWYNLVLSSVPIYGFSQGEAQQIFDMHGTGPGGYGFIGGYSVDIAGNTFLGNRHNNWNFELRGHPCSTDYFRDNVSQREQDSNGGGVINFHNIGDPGVPLLLQGPDVAHTPVSAAPDLQISEVIDSNNQFGNSSPPFTDPTTRFGPSSLGVGDFDADGDDDLFLATGTAWYYSPAGAREWRFVSAKSDTIDQLLFGDFDADGRTDVVTLKGGQFLVSWGGASDWEVLNPDPTGGRLLLLPSAITAMAVGDFDGDGRADIFWADGGTWWISYGGSTPFIQVIVASNLFAKDLRFGDFNGDGTTDVFGVVGGNWMVRYAPKGYQGLLGGWQVLRPALTNTVDGLVVGDFAGTGTGVSVGMSCDSLLTPGCWQISAGGIQDWHTYTIGSGPVVLAAVGHFLGRVDAYQHPLPTDLLFWNARLPLITVAMCDSSVGVDTEFCLSVGGIFPSFRYASQDMR